MFEFFSSVFGHAHTKPNMSYVQARGGHFENELTINFFKIPAKYHRKICKKIISSILMLRNTLRGSEGVLYR